MKEEALIYQSPLVSDLIPDFVARVPLFSQSLILGSNIRMLALCSLSNFRYKHWLKVITDGIYMFAEIYFI